MSKKCYNCEIINNSCKIFLSVNYIFLHMNQQGYHMNAKMLYGKFLENVLKIYTKVHINKIAGYIQHENKKTR